MSNATTHRAQTTSALAPCGALLFANVEPPYSRTAIRDDARLAATLARHSAKIAADAQRHAHAINNSRMRVALGLVGQPRTVTVTHPEGWTGLNTAPLAAAPTRSLSPALAARRARHAQLRAQARERTERLAQYDARIANVPPLPTAAEVLARVHAARPDLCARLRRIETGEYRRAITA